MLLQAEVNKAKDEITRNFRLYKEEILTFETSVKLLSDPSIDEIKDQVAIKKKNVIYDNIAGTEVPTLDSIDFKEKVKTALYKPFWHDDMVDHLRCAKKAFLKWKISEEKKALLEEELRSVSIRVNLFEKRLIPRTESEISQIRIFLGDQDLAAVSLSKLAKEKLEKRKLEKEIPCR
ncbi:MAG: V-type ATP synthase subunit D [Chlamydiia bacterium]|nr:V-type ATP synthase subunit D [Chlamydiia bacterium]